MGDVNNDLAARLLGQPAALIQVWRQCGMNFRLRPDCLEVVSGDAVVGRQWLTSGGVPVGPYEVVVNTRE